LSCQDRVSFNEQLVRSKEAIEAQTRTMTRICIVAHFSYGAITGGKRGHIGGVERQTSLMARWLAARGHRVSLLTWDEGQDDETAVDGVRLIKMCRRDSGLPVARFFHPRWSSLCRAMRQADADLYYQNCAEYVTGQVALWCRKNGRRFVYSVASDPECDPRLPEMRTMRERVLYRYGIRNADGVIVQTRKQQRMLEEGFGLPSVILSMPCDGPSETDYRPPPPAGLSGSRILWVGRISPEKRPHLFLEVAASLPDVEFDMAGSSDGDGGYAGRLLSNARALPNVRVHGRVEVSRMPALYRNSTLLFCTSLYEGFPNTFLEAWSYGLPIVSTCDPDGLLADRSLGIAAADRQSLVAGIRQLLGSASRWREMSGNARRFYLQNHAVDPAMGRFEKVFLNVLGAGTAPDGVPRGKRTEGSTRKEIR